MLQNNSGGGIVGTICLDSLLLQGPIQFKSVSKLSFSIKGNEHGHLVVTGFLDEDSGSSAVYKALAGPPFGIIQRWLA